MLQITKSYNMQDLGFQARSRRNVGKYPHFATSYCTFNASKLFITIWTLICPLLNDPMNQHIFLFYMKEMHCWLFIWY